jgi:hypothetical protein
VIQQIAGQLPEPATEKLRVKEADALATLIRRDPETVKGWIANARAELQQRASRYGEVHAAAVEAALAAGEHDVAARESRAMLEKLADDQGNRVLDAEREAQSGVTVQIGLALGGIAHSP